MFSEDMNKSMVIFFDSRCITSTTWYKFKYKYSESKYKYHYEYLVLKYKYKYLP